MDHRVYAYICANERLIPVSEYLDIV